MKEPVETVSAQALPITDDNVGSKMLKAMGWTEGSGLGKSNQGTADIIQVERRRGGLGLGNNNATFTSEYFALFRIWRIKIKLSLSPYWPSSSRRII